MTQILICAISLVVLVAFALWLKNIRDAHAFHLWKDIVIPLLTPAVVALVGVLLTQTQKNIEDLQFKRQHQMEMLRRVMLSEDRYDVSFLNAVAGRMVIHLDRDQQLKRREQQGEKIKLNQPSDFDVKAAFFFFCMYRAAITDLTSKSAFLVFPEAWMGNAYSSLAYAIPKHILGGREIADLRVSLEEEAAVYKFFGKRSSNATRISEQGKQIEPLLFDFYWLLSSKANFDRPLDQNLVTVLQDGFKRFKESLDHINPKELHETVTAMAVLQMYGITGVLYEGQVKIPTQVSKLPRSDFVELFGGDKVRAERVWEHILSPTNVVIHPD